MAKKSTYMLAQPKPETSFIFQVL